MTRVQIPAYSSHWMRGDRYGEIVKTGWLRSRKDKLEIEVARVKLDKSGKTILVTLSDCTVIS